MKIAFLNVQIAPQNVKLFLSEPLAQVSPICQHKCMGKRPGRNFLNRTVKVDETYVGGKKKGGILNLSKLRIMKREIMT